MRIADCNGTPHNAYTSIEEAIAAYEEKYGKDAFAKDDGHCNCSLGIDVDETMTTWFVVDHPHYFTDCYKEDLELWFKWNEKNG